MMHHYLHKVIGYITISISFLNLPLFYCSKLCPASFANENMQLNGYPSKFFQNSVTDISQGLNCTDFPFYDRDKRDLIVNYPINYNSVTTCYRNLCPVDKSHVESFMGITQWEEKTSPSLCNLKKNTDLQNRINLIIMGGSMTWGSSAEDGCFCINATESSCPSIHTYIKKESFCAWQGFFGRWLPNHINKSVDVINLANSGINTKHMLQIFPENMGGRTISKNDVILIDHSVNDDEHYLPGILETHLEKLIRKIVHFSQDGFPNIIILETKPAHVKNPSYYIAYRAVAKHYKVPIWSFQNVLQHAEQPISEIGKLFNHPPSFVHKFLADLIASAFELTLNKCDGINMSAIAQRTFSDLPNNLINTTEIKADHYCDRAFPYSVHAYPASTQHYSKNDTYKGWRQLVDGKHMVPGFIIDKNSGLLKENRQLSFRLENVTNYYELHFKVTYLKTYFNAGAFSMSLCGEAFIHGDAGVIDTLDRTPNHHYSVPEFALPSISDAQINACKQLISKSLDKFFTIHFEPLGDGNKRFQQKVKILNVVACVLNKF